MAISPEIMALLSGGDGKDGGDSDKSPKAGGSSKESPAPSTLEGTVDGTQSGDSQAPSASGMAKPTNRAGAKAIARTQVQLAVNVLGRALASFGDPDDDDQSITEDKDTILSVMNRLANKFGSSSEKELVPAQILELVKSEPSLSGALAQKQQPQQSQQQQQPQQGAS
jgi:hypothetical protein